jgi:hypothetical protein
MRQLADRPRATRYEISAPVMYRCLGEGPWRLGRTENISRSGVLFKAAVPALAASARIEFFIKLPDVGAPDGSWVRCQGHVARHRDGVAAGVCAMAVTIDEYKFLGFAPLDLPGIVES